MTLLLLMVLLFPALQAEPTVRVRLFSTAQPSSLSLTREGKTAQQIRASQTQLLVDGRAIQSPLRTTGPAVLRVPDNEDVRVQYPVEISIRGGTLVIVSVVPREAYIAGVVAGEAGSFRSENSLKAMAVAARTFAAHFISRHKSEGFDFCDTTHCQDYRGSGIPSRVSKAVVETAGELIWQSGTPIAAYYHQDCGGITEARINDTYCVSSGRTQWTTELTREDLQALFQIRSARKVEVVSRTAAGRAATVRIEGSTSRQFTAETFRLAVGRALGWNRIRSDLYHVRTSGDRFIFEGYGSGHGIGLCQRGAAVMGEKGHSYREILAFYYPNTTVSTKASGISWIKLGGPKADLETTQSQDADVLNVTGRLMRGLEESTGRTFSTHPLIRIYPTVAAYRDATGEPGWMAASTKNNTIRLQPAASLKARSALDSTLRHELAHILLEARMRGNSPLWYREGLVLWLTQPRPANLPSTEVDLAALEQSLARPQSEAQLRQAYRKAHETIEGLVRKHGKETMLSWIERGLPHPEGVEGR